MDIAFVKVDGGRSAAGFTGETRDCVCRAIAIAAELPYRQVYDVINGMAVHEKSSPRKRGKSAARTGVHKTLYKKLLADMGWLWTPTMGIGTGCTVHLRPDELPDGRLIVSVSRHLTVVINGVIYDMFDPSNDGTRCVYGYWAKPC